MKDFQTLLVWRKSHQLVLEVYRHSVVYPRDELFGLTSQTRRCAASIPANIAEGCGRGSDPDFARFMQIAMGSACELEYHLLLAKDLCYLNEEDYRAMCAMLVEVKRMLSAFLKTLKSHADR